MRTTIVAACAALIAVAGCGGSDGLTRKELAKRANAICAKYSKQAQALGSPDLTSPDKARAYFEKATDLTKKQQADLEDLEPADSVKSDYAKLTDATGEVATLLGDLADAADDKDQKQGAALIQKLTPLSTKVDTAASGIGAGTCGN